MWRRISIAALMGVGFVPMIALAQTPRTCVAPFSVLQRGDTSDAVSNLQLFLARDKNIYPEGSVIGTFGPATERAVGRWQIKFGLLSPGASKGDGLGRVGPKTLALLQKVWDCSGPVSAGWFRAFVSGGTVTFSAQASSTYPIDPSLLSIEFGDGTRTGVSVSSAVCTTLGDNCSSLLYASHTYPTGSFTASLNLKIPSDQCAVFSPAWICAQAAQTKTLGTISLTSNGRVAAVQAGTTVSGVGSGVATSTRVIQVRTPTPTKPPSVAGAIVLSGGTLTLAWTSTSTPLGSSAELLLTDNAGNIIGTIAQNNMPSGSYWWTIPRESPSTCTADALTCLSQIATVTCTGGICPLKDGTYGAVVRIRSGGSVIALAKLGTFTLNSGALSVLLSATPANNSGIATSSYAAYGAVPATNSVVPQSCMYSGVQYGDGISLNVSCSDLAGSSCATYGGASLTCKNGAWVNASGTATSIPSVTTSFTATGTNCKTPWGSQTVQNGMQITYEPFFTGGSYTGATVINLMQCTNGKWQKCDWQGSSCRDYTVI